MNPAAIKSLTPCQAAGSTRSFWGYYPGTESRRGSQECPDTVLRTPLWTPLEVVVPHKDTWTPGHHPLANCPPGLREVHGPCSKPECWERNMVDSTSAISWLCDLRRKPLHLSEHLDPHLENAYNPRFNEKTKQHDVCGHALEATKCAIKVRTMTLH